MTDDAETHDFARDDKSRVSDEFMPDIRAVVAAGEGWPIELTSDFGLLTDEERILDQTLSLLETGAHMVGLSADPVIAEGASASSLSWSY